MDDRHFVVKATAKQEQLEAERVASLPAGRVVDRNTSRHARELDAYVPELDTDLLRRRYILDNDGETKHLYLPGLILLAALACFIALGFWLS